MIVSEAGEGAVERLGEVGEMAEAEVDTSMDLNRIDSRNTDSTVMVLTDRNSSSNPCTKAPQLPILTKLICLNKININSIFWIIATP